MPEQSKARQRAANTQADNIIDTDRVHHDGVPRGQEIESNPNAINRNKKTPAEPEGAQKKMQDPEDPKFNSGGGSRGVKGHTGDGKGPLGQDLNV